MNKKQTIKCDVKNCKYNNQKKCLCDLEEIKVCGCEKNCNCKDETICDSFVFNEEE